MRASDGPAAGHAGHGRPWVWPVPVVVAACAGLALSGMNPVATSARQGTPAAAGAIAIEAVRVPLNPKDPATQSVGDFEYAGGVRLRSSGTDLLHELSDLAMVDAARDRFAAVGDAGVLWEGRLVLDGSGRLSGVADATVTRLLGEDGKPVSGVNADSEGLAVLANGDRLVSFERRARVWRYAKDGGRPRPAPFPHVYFEPNQGMEALAADPANGPDAYIVGAEQSGDTWSCRLAAACVKGPTVVKPQGFGLVGLTRVSGDTTAYLLRAYDAARGARVRVQIHRGAAVVARMELAAPLTVDNFEGVASVERADGTRRLYLISDDNQSPVQRTLLLAFDWVPR